MSSGGDPNGNEGIDHNVIRMRVLNVKNMTISNGATSKVKRIDGYPWRLHVSLNYKEELCAYIRCRKWEEIKVFESEAEIEVKLVNHNDYSRSMCKKENKLFDYIRTHHGFSLVKFQDVLNDESYVFDGSIVVEAKINVTGGHGDRFRNSNRPKPDFFSPSKFADVVLSIEGRKFHVSKQILAHASPYFEVLFFGDFKESQKNEIALEDVFADEFLTTLQFIYKESKTSHNYSEDNLLKMKNILKMADRFDIPSVMNQVEDWLICLENKDIPLDISFLLSDSYNLFSLQDYSLRRISDKESALGIMDSDSYKQFSSGLKDKISKRLEHFMPENRSGNEEDRDSAVSGVIRFRVENVKNLKKDGVKSEVMSEVVWINGFPWKLWLDVYESNLPVLRLVREESPIFRWWHCFAEGKVRLINHNDDSASISEDFSDEFFSCKSEDYGWYWEDIFEWDDVIGNGDFVVDGSIVFEAEINVKGRHGDKFPKVSKTDFFSPSNYSDVVFIVERQKLYASKQILAYASSYFEKLFHGDSEDSNEKEIVLDDLSLEDMLESLEMINDPERSVNDCIVEPVLGVAFRFEITAILDDAERFLLHRSKLPLHIKLRLSDQYNLEVLQNTCLRGIREVKTVDELMKSDSYKHYSRDLVDSILKKTIQLSRRK